ncbi:hypothetical protein ACIQUM_07390 [Amycolatopsis azurea]|uniref:hypothetical protein n=1 Tax=Amycolatopsis azurea TaxID=36819 RepID=UPI0038252A53
MVQPFQRLDLAAEKHPMRLIGISARDQLHRYLMPGQMVGGLHHRRRATLTAGLRQNHVPIGHRAQHIAPLADIDRSTLPIPDQLIGTTRRSSESVSILWTPFSSTGFDGAPAALAAQRTLPTFAAVRTWTAEANYPQARRAQREPRP